MICRSLCIYFQSRQWCEVPERHVALAHGGVRFYSWKRFLQRNYGRLFYSFSRSLAELCNPTNQLPFAFWRLFMQLNARTKKIFVGGLSASTREEDIKEYFSSYGAVRGNNGEFFCRFFWFALFCPSALASFDGSADGTHEIASDVVPATLVYQN